MPTARKKTALLNGLDQYSAYYSVICVFGSVVGCVVVPLITQSIESIIFSAIIISLTAKTIHSRALTLKEEPQEERRRSPKDSSVQDRKTKRKKVQSLPRDTDVVRRQRQDELLRLHEQRTVEKEQKLEERRLKKARKREEKMKQKEEEEREKTREAQQRKEREDKRAQLRQRKSLGALTPLDSIDSLTRQPILRERKNSSSSSGSARSTRSLPRPRPPRMTRDSFSRALSDSNLPFAPLPSPSLPSPSLPSPTLPSPTLPSPTLPSPSLSPIRGIGPAPLVQISQSKQSSTQSGNGKLHKEKSKITTSLLPSSHPHYNHSSNNNHPPPTHGQVYAVNPLNPSPTLPMATSVSPTTITKTTTAKGCNWNELSYYYSLERAGLTRPLQFGWDPVTSPSNGSQHAPLCSGLQLDNSQPWGPGPFSAPVKSVVSPVSTPPPPPSVFGVIGKALTCGTTQAAGHATSPKGLSDNDSSMSGLSSILNNGRGTSNSGGYSLFDGTGQSLFGNSLLCGQFEVQQGDTEKESDPLTSSNEGATPQHKDEAKKEKFDDWPAL